MKVKRDQIPDNIAGTHVAIDVELFKMERRQLHRVSGEFASLAVSDGETVYLITNPDLIPEMIKCIKGKVWIMHNAGFDLFHLRRWTKIPHLVPSKFHDTMVWERLLWNGYYDDFSLDACVRRYLSIDLDKSIRKKFETATSMTTELLKYAAEDAYYTFHVFDAQIKTLETCPFETDIQSIWDNIDGPMIELVPNFKGITINKQAWECLATENKIIADKFKASLPYNPASPKQVLTALRKAGVLVSGTNVDVLTDIIEGVYNSTAKTIADNVLTFRKAAKLVGTYGFKFIDDFLEDDGRIYAHYWVVGAATGRMASADPNMQNIPRDNRFRSCFVAPPNHKLVVADYAQQEVRVLAHISKDVNLLKILASGSDPHLLVARRVYRDPKMTKNDPRRFHGKTINLALSYGLTAEGLARQTDLSLSEATDIVSRYFIEFPGVKEYINHYRYIGDRRGYVQTPSGRVTWLNPYSTQWPNIAINAPVQGGAADQTKLALVLLYGMCKEKGLEYPVVLVAHDEIVAEFPTKDANEGKKLVDTAMIQAGEQLFPDAPWKVDAKLGQNWGIKDEKTINE